jgi:hypothetical protein
MHTRIRLAITVAALAAGTALFGTPGAIATQGQPVLAGVENTATSPTLIANTNEVSLNDCEVVNNFVDSGLVACGFHGVSGLGGPTGVFGSGSSAGVFGSGPSRGVLGTSSSTGVFGEASGSGRGVLGTSSIGYGVFGTNTGSTGIGVYGKTGGTGSAVFGQATANGLGVFASSQSGTALRAASASGTALQVNGKAKFSRSGLTTIAAGTASKTISLAGVSTSSMVIATAQQNVNVFIKAAVPSGGSFKLWLNGNAPVGGLKVAYFVLN